MSKRIFGLIGWPVEHSWSPGWFTNKFTAEGITDAEYRLFPLRDISLFPSWLNEIPRLAGLNVTIPHKEKIIPYLDSLDNSARAIGAVNVVLVEHRESGIHTCGYNTDAAGFLDTLENVRITGPALILGTGGAAKAVACALGTLNIPYLFVSRKSTASGIITYQEISETVLASHPLIIQATPVGMFPDTAGFPPIPYGAIGPGHCLYDLVYNPEMTEFLKRGKAMGAKTISGYGMLMAQAERSFRLFTRKS